MKQSTGFVSARDNLISAAFSAAMDFSNFVSLNAGRGIDDSFAAQVLYNLPVLPIEDIEEMAPEEVVESIENFFALLLEKLQNLEINWMNVIGILGTVLAIYSAVFAHLQVYWAAQSDAQAEARHAVVIEAIQLGNAQVLAAIEKHHPRNSTPVLYVTERITTVRVAPKTRSLSIALIPPGNRVELRDRKGRWIRVEFFDYIDGYSKSGWVMKKYLQIIKD